jgi:AraC-like DNA-binding protein
MNAIRFIFLIASIQGFITFLALFSFGKSHRKANYYLSFTVLILAINMLSDYLFHGKEPLEFMSHGNFHALLGFAYGPFIYLYTRALTGVLSPGKGMIAIYFIPFSLASLYMLMCTVPGLYPTVGKYYFLVELLSLFNNLVFIVLSIICIKRYEKAITNSFSNLEKLSLQWVRIILYSISGIMIIAMALYLAKVYFDLIWVLLALLIYFMSYYSLRRPEILTGLVAEGKYNKYVKSSLSPELIHKNKSKIEKCMQEEKVFLDSEITLPVLAEKLSIPVHHLSQIINQEYGKNFYEFISYFRIEAAREMMRSPEYTEMKIIDICYRVGFNSISAFNKSFKNFSGLTPTQFRKNNSQS